MAIDNRPQDPPAGPSPGPAPDLAAAPPPPLGFSSLADAEAWAAVAAGPQMAELRLLAGVLGVARELAAEVARNHPRGRCRCPLCQYRGYRQVMAELPHLAWAINAIGSPLEADISPLSLDGDTFGDDLRTLAELHDRYQAGDVAEPHVVG